MVRRSFRLGLWAGLLLGVAAALVKTMQGRRDGKELATPPPDRWAPAPVATAAPATAAPVQDDRRDSEPWPTDITVAPDGDESLGEPEEVDLPSPPPRPPGAVKSVPAGDAPATEPAVAPRKTVAAAKRVADTATPTPVVKAMTWVRPVAGVCPPTHPVKGKLTSRLFHLPGMFAYDRTRADRCYISEAAAVADGLTRAKR